MHDSLYPVAELIRKRLQTQPRAVVALEGPAAAGKTTAAAQLSAHFNAPVIHADDFFLPFEMRTPQRLAQPGGNIHYERFLQEVGDGLQSGKDFEYRVFDCGTGEMGEVCLIPNSPVLLVEGVYCLHPCLRGLYDIKVFVAVDEKLQQERLLRRGAALYQRFQSLWLPLEAAYYQDGSIAALCDLTVTLTEHKKSIE